MSTNSQQRVQYNAMFRTEENGPRRARTLRLDDGSAQIQGKEARVSDEKRYLQLRYWTYEAGWTQLVVDPTVPGIAGIIAVGSDPDNEQDSWADARAEARKAGVEL